MQVGVITAYPPTNILRILRRNNRTLTKNMRVETLLEHFKWRYPTVEAPPESDLLVDYQRKESPMEFRQNGD